MRYSEEAVPDTLEPFVRAIWRMEAGGLPTETLQRTAAPDGCIELIMRLEGRSSWRTSQPARFVAGLCTGPARLELSGDAAFAGARLWPWAWNLLGDLPCPGFHNRWIAPDPTSRAGRLLGGGTITASCLAALFAGLPASDIGRHVVASASTGELAERSGQGHRTLQRWFKREIGLSPRQYFRLLRFQNAVGDDARPATRLADKAADAGYADQAHMTRDYRRFAGETPARMRRASAGPFVKGRET